jgi:N utilization substance protein A
LKKIVREPGEKAKVAVESFDDRIDPVGACVGMKGSRIHAIVRELKNENIDIVNYTSNLNLMIQRALAPAKIDSLSIDEENKKVAVYLKPDQISLAIGKKGLKIDVFRDVEEVEDDFDIDLEEFSDEIDAWVIDILKGIGCDTARSVLDLDPEELARRADLEDETVQHVISVLKAEFED